MVKINESTHTYTNDKGLIVPGVTSVIDHLANYAGIPQDVLDHKAEIGKAAHKACELHDNNELDWCTVDDLIEPYVRAWLNFKYDTDFEVLLNEHFVFHTRHNYAGMLDRVGILNGKLCVIDLKCTAVIGPHTGVQVAAYAEAENSQRKKSERIEKCFACQLKPDGTYRLVEFKDIKGNFSVFLASLTLYNWRVKHDRLINS